MEKSDIFILIFIALSIGWFLGRFTEAMAVGNLHF